MWFDFKFAEWQKIRCLFLSDGACAHSEAQFDPFFRNRRKLGKACGLRIVHKSVGANWRIPTKQIKQADLIGLKFFYKTPRNVVLERVAAVVSSMKPGCKLVYFDGNDEANIQWPDLLHHCDVYWKKQVLANLVDAVRNFHGGTNLTHYAAQLPFSEAEPQFAETTLLGKIVLGSSLALDEKINRFTKSLLGAPKPDIPRPIDIVFRGKVPDNWMGTLRRPAVAALESLAGDYAVLLPTTRVTPEQYASEMESAKICLSPFGYGEVCYRDYEAALHGCLLFKPDMSHLRTDPDFYRPFETYVPLRWDYSDLGEKLERYLADDSARLRIVENSRRVLREALEPDWFVARVKALLAAAGLNS